MATRSIVTIQGYNKALYIHWDGHPNAKLPFLIDFYSHFHSVRGGENQDYCLAQLIRATVTLGPKYKLDDSNTTGYGVCSSKDDLGQEYTYRLMKNGDIQVNGVTVWQVGNAVPHWV